MDWQDALQDGGQGRVMTHTRYGLFVVGWICAACGAADVSQSDLVQQPGRVLETLRFGTFSPTNAYARGAMRGRVQLVTTLTGETRLQIHLTGLEPSTNYEARVHRVPCAFGAGTRYLRDPENSQITDANTISLAFTSSADGTANGQTLEQHRTRGDALSVVVPDPVSGAVMLCADLRAGTGRSVVWDGAVAPFADAQTQDLPLNGTVRVVRNAQGTRLALTLSGLIFNETYDAQVHTLPCNLNQGGDVYRLDPTATPGQASNELRPQVQPSEEGNSQDVFELSGHQARTDAQSLIVYRTTGGNRRAVSCANLQRQQWPKLRTDGFTWLTDTAVQRGFGNLGVDVSMVRDLRGQTEVNLRIEGLNISSIYALYVHDLPCDIQSGGDRYRIDPNQALGNINNELSLRFTTDSNGAAKTSLTALHVARPEAQSVVMRDPVDQVLLACIDLN